MYGDPSEPAATHRFVFTGTGTEYFQVWIVNVLLTMLTFGIYSAWAKVRNKQYFYGNTHLDGSAFEYTANPVTILKGRLIVVAFFVAYSIVAGVLPPVEPVLGLLVLLLVPWVVVRALSFNLRYSAHRNLRFGFSGRYGHAFAIYVLGPLAALLTGGLLWPLIVYVRKRFIVENSRYGSTHFTFDATPGRFYVIYLVAVGIALAFAAVVGAALLASGALDIDPKALEESDAEIPEPLAALGATALLAYGVLVAMVAVYIQVKTANYQWQSTRLGENRFDLRLDVLPMLWIQASNLVLIVLTLGLFVPFARVRLARYRIDRLSLEASGSLDDFAAGERARTSALGDEFGEALDLDLGL